METLVPLGHLGLAASILDAQIAAQDGRENVADVKLALQYVEDALNAKLYVTKDNIGIPRV